MFSRVLTEIRRWPGKPTAAPSRTSIPALRRAALRASACPPTRGRMKFDCEGGAGDPCPRRRRVGFDPAYARCQHRHTVGHEYPDKDYDGEKEVEYRTGRDDSRALDQPLMRKGARDIACLHLLLGVLPYHLDITPQGKRAQGIFGLPDLSAQQFRAKTDGKGEDADAGLFCQEEVSELVDDDQNPQTYEGCQDRINNIDHLFFSYILVIRYWLLVDSFHRITSTRFNEYTISNL